MTRFLPALHLGCVGFFVGVSVQGKQNIKARQALGFALEVQVQNIGAPEDVLIRLGQLEGGDLAQQASVDKIKATLEKAGAAVELK